MRLKNLRLRIRGATALGGVALGLLVGVENAWPAPQTFNTALPVAQGEFVFREQFLSRRIADDPGPAGRDVSVFGGVSVLGYGITGDLSVFGVAPILSKELELTTPDGSRITRRTSGLGDARVFGRYTVFHADAPGRTFRIAPFGGIKAPTGDNDDRDALGRLPPTLQLGSGSWDPFSGVVVTYQTRAYQIDAAASYQANTPSNGFEFGDEARFDASFQYRLWPRKLRGGVPGFLYAVIEENLILRGRNTIGGVRDLNSGGTTLFLAPGLQYVTKRWILEAIVQIPVLQDLNGLALRDSYTVRAGFRFNF